MPISGLLCLSFSLACAAPTKVPVTPKPCPVPAFHLQAPCAGDDLCLYAEFARTLQAEKAVDSALTSCPYVIR